MTETPYLNDLQREAEEVPTHPRERLKYLTRLRNEITFEITRIRSMLGLPLVERPVWYCRRCGNEWAGFSIDRPPRSCPRCHSVGWNEEPVSRTARKPTDKPNPRWYKRKDPPPLPTLPTPLIIVPSPPIASASPGLPPPPAISEWTAPPARPSLAEQLREKLAVTNEIPGGGGSTVERDPSKVDQAGSTPVPRSDVQSTEEATDDSPPADDSEHK